MAESKYLAPDKQYRLITLIFRSLGLCSVPKETGRFQGFLRSLNLRLAFPLGNSLTNLGVPDSPPRSTLAEVFAARSPGPAGEALPESQVYLAG